MLEVERVEVPRQKKSVLFFPSVLSNLGFHLRLTRDVFDVKF